MTSWWRVKRTQDPAWDFMVLVVKGRVAVCTMKTAFGIEVGALWKTEREKLNAWGASSTMESAP